MPRSPVSKFVWRILLWLPLCFAGWYLMAGYITLPVNFVVSWLVGGLLPEVVREIIPNRHLVDVVCAVELPPQAGVVVPQGQIAELVFSINSLIYGYSIPLFTALIISSPGEEMSKWSDWIAGILILMAAQVWGISFDILKTLLFDLGSEVRGQLAFSSFQQELVALGYQFGYLILPAVTPLILWIGFNRQFLAELIRK